MTLHTARQTQFQHVQSAFNAAGVGRLHVTPVDAGPGRVANTFVVRFTDRMANNYAALRKAITDVSAEFPLTEEPVVRAIEVACDFTHRGSRAERDSATVSMAHRLQTSLLTNSVKPRQFDPSIGKNGKNRFMDAPGLRLNPELNFRVGNKWDDVAWQVYWKTTDKTMALPPAEWRARVEVTLQGVALESVGLAMLSDLDGYKFARLARFFRFRTPIDPDIQANGNRYKLVAIKANRRLNDATPERGLHSFESLGRRDKWRKLRSESSHLQADNELQRAVKDALRHLKL